MLKSVTFPAVIALYSFSVLCLLAAALSTFPNLMGSAEAQPQPTTSFR